MIAPLQAGQRATIPCLAMIIFRGRIRWLLIFLVFVISSIAYLDRVNISVAGSWIEREYGLEHVQLGWVFSAFLVGYGLFQAPGGRLADRFGPRNIIALATLWWAVFTALTALVPPNFPGALLVLLGVRFLLGVGEAVVYPASNLLVAKWIPSRERGAATGCIFAGVGVGAGVTPPLIAYTILHYGWRWSFWISAIIGLAAGLVWVMVARNQPEEHSWVAAQEIAHIRSGLVEAAGEVQPAAPISWRAILFNKNVLALTLSFFCYGYVAHIFLSWFFIYLNTVRGLDLKASAYYGMLPFLAIAIGSPLGGWISDRAVVRYGKRVGRCFLACATMGLCAIFVGLGTHAHDARLASVVLAGGAGLLYMSLSAFWSVTADIAGPSTGAVSGVMNMGSHIGGAVTSSLTPVLAVHYGWGASFFVAAAVCVAGALIWLVVDPADKLSMRNA